MKRTIRKIIGASMIDRFGRSSKPAGDALRQQRAWFEVTLSSVGDGVIAADTNGSVAFINPAAQSLTGWKQEEAEGQSLEDVFRIVHEITRERVENPALQALKEGRVLGLANHTVLLAKDGTEVSVDDSGAPIKDAEGRLLGAVLVFRDITERRRDEEARAWLAGIVDSSDDAIVGKDLNGVIRSWNVAAELLFEYSAKEAIGQPITIIIPREKLEEEQAILKRLRAGERIVHFETVRRSKSGKEIHISLTVSPVRDGSGRIIGASKIARDITEYRKAEQICALLARVVDSSDDAIITKGLDGVITSWNATAQRLFEYSADEAIGRSVTLIIPTERLDEERMILERLKRGEQIDHFETVRISKSGKRIDISLTTSPVRDSTGQIIGASKIARDITERKRTEEIIREQRELLEVTLSSIGDGVIATDSNGVITFINPVAQSLTGWSREEAEGQHLEKIFRILNEQTRQPIANPALRAMTEGAIVGLANHGVLIAKDGRGVFIDDSGAPIKDIDGKLLGAVLVFRNIGERRLAEAERLQLLASERAARGRAEAANRAKDEFVAMISHEIRSPLNAIVGWSSILRQQNLDKSTVERGLETIERNAKAQAQLLEDLLDISRVVTGKLDLDVRPVDITKIVEASLDSMRPAADARSIKIDLQVEQGVQLVSGDADRLRQIFFNLFSNAVKFTPANGRVVVTMKCRDSHFEVTISDSGAGISPEFLPYVFDRFTQANSSTSRKHGGLGLGLAITRHLVELHGGTVRAESPGEGLGATFTVTLPLTGFQKGTADFEEAVKDTVDHLLDTTALSSVRVLIVDDDAGTRELLKTMLTGKGALVETCASAAEALELIQAWRPTVLVSDIGMPDEDGYMLIRKVRTLASDQRNIPAVALTAYARNEDRMLALASGFQMHLSKPVEAPDLIKVITSLIDLAAPSS